MMDGTCVISVGEYVAGTFVTFVGNLDGLFKGSNVGSSLIVGFVAGVGVFAVGMLVVVGSSSFGMFGFDVVVGFDDDDDDDDGPCAKNGARGINIIVDEVLVIPKT